jgi:hypothetical protein
MLKLYLLPGSLHSNRALHMIEKKNLNFQKIPVSDPNTLANIDTLLGINKLPAITYNNHKYEGLYQIQDFIETNALK